MGSIIENTEAFEKQFNWYEEPGQPNLRFADVILKKKFVICQPGLEVTLNANAHMVLSSPTDKALYYLETDSAKGSKVKVVASPEMQKFLKPL